MAKSLSLRKESTSEAQFVAPLEARRTVSARTHWLRSTHFWAVSATLHLGILLILLGIRLTTVERTPQTVIALRRRPPPPPTRRSPSRALKPAPRVPAPRQQTPAPALSLEQPTRAPEPRKDPVVRLPEIGFAGSTALFARRQGKIGLAAGGGSRETESAVRAALEWLRRHQSDDGSWQARDFTERCRTPCTNLAGPLGRGQPAGDGRGLAEHDIGVTSLAMLAFAGFGQSHRDGIHPEYVACLRRAVAYLKRSQVRSSDPAENGRFGSDHHEQWIYDHALATLALSELLAMSRDMIGLGRPVRDAARLCLAAQNPGFGWRYGIRPGDNDTSVTGWMVLALKAARQARATIEPDAFGDAFAGVRQWLDRVTAQSGRTGYEFPGDRGAQLGSLPRAPYPYSKELSATTAVGVLCRLFAGESRRSAAVRRGVELLVRKPPSWDPGDADTPSSINLYYWYYGAYALYQFGGQAWKDWNGALQKALLPTQRRGEIDENGSWDPIGEWGAVGGRVYATALAAMTLEVYYRYERGR